MNPSKSGSDAWKNIFIKEFSAPQSDLKATHVIHSPAPEILEGASYTIEALIVSTQEPKSVTVSILTGSRPKVYEMKKASGYRYTVTIPKAEINEGFLLYFITVNENEKTITYPGGQAGSPADWDFNARDPFQVEILSPSSPIYIFEALTDNDEMSRIWNKGSSFVPLAEPGKAEIRVSIEKLFTIDPENPNANRVHDYSMRYYFGKKIRGSASSLSAKVEIVFRGRSVSTKPCWVQLALITKQGEAYGGVVKVESATADYKLKISELRKVKLVTLPRPYPTFLPYFFEDDRGGKMDINAIESLQISVGPGTPENELGNTYELAVESVRLE